MNESHETSNLPGEPGRDINLHEPVDDLDTIDQMIGDYFTPERLDQQWQRIVETARSYGADPSRRDDSPDPALPDPALLGQDEPDLLDISHCGASDALRAPLELAAPQTDTVPAASTVFPRRAGPYLAQGGNISRAANRAVDALESLAVPGLDLRMMNPSDREETRATIAELRELLSKCPPGTFGAEGSAVILAAVAPLSETLIADRDERTALRLIHAASPQLKFLGRSHPAVFEVRRARAEALSELGQYRRAEKMLHQLSEDERRVFGSDDHRTALLLLWALIGSDRLQKAEEGFRALETRLAQPRDASTPMLWHLQCRYSWLLGRQGRVSESARGYDGVIVNRSHELGADHADASDARHSKGKMLVFAGEGSQAVALLHGLADDRARVQGDRHADTLETLKYLHLAHALAEPRDDRVVDRSINALLEILHIQDERHGPVYPHEP
ncbi:hypothetical protein [Acrocarpospora sp. B8E8]|uniref:hypothetical protein n=1 Tax=Acrocarpospora sp. B8E8 TaxID=3153572 RepID=UPI00325C607D